MRRHGNVIVTISLLMAVLSPLILDSHASATTSVRPRSVVKERIIGGEVPEVPSDWTFMVALFVVTYSNNAYFRCGGTLIDELHILSASHCFFSALLIAPASLDEAYGGRTRPMCPSKLPKTEAKLQAVAEVLGKGRVIGGGLGCQFGEAAANRLEVRREPAMLVAWNCGGGNREGSLARAQDRGARCRKGPWCCNVRSCSGRSRSGAWRRPWS